MNLITFARFRSRWFRLAMLLMVLLHVGCFTSFAQSTQGSILGVVKDTNGALVPGATVTLTNVDEGVVRTIKTNAAGNYLFADVVASHYNVAITAPGFALLSASRAACTWSLRW